MSVTFDAAVPRSVHVGTKSAPMANMKAAMHETMIERVRFITESDVLFAAGHRTKF
jgi:hypothetical protein